MLSIFYFLFNLYNVKTKFKLLSVHIFYLYCNKEKHWVEKTIVRRRRTKDYSKNKNCFSKGELYSQYSQINSK